MLVIKNAPTTAISEVTSSSMIIMSFICRLRNIAGDSFPGKVRATYACAEK